MERAAYPEARLFAAPGLADKRKDLRFDGELSATSDPAWAEDLDQVLFDGHRLLDQVELFHRASRTLIAGDLIFNIGPDWPLWTRLLVDGPRLRRRIGPTPLFRLRRPRQGSRTPLGRPHPAVGVRPRGPRSRRRHRDRRPSGG